MPDKPTALRPTAREQIKWIRTTYRNRCPICHKYSWCEVSSDGAKAHCMHQPSGIEMRYRQGGWLHILRVDFAPSSAADLRPGSHTNIMTSEQSNFHNNIMKVGLAVDNINSFKPLPPAQVSQIFHAYLALCPLSAEHRKYLESESVPTAGCGSLTYKDAPRIARQLVGKFGAETCRRHPLLIEVTGKDGRKWWTLASAADGILLPATDHDGLVLGVQIRKDQPKGSDDRYKWQSHEGLGGTPLTVFRAGPGAEAAHMTILTEGYKKAVVAASAWRCHAISVAGVSAYNETELIKTLDALGASVIVLAFDQDKRQNAQVKKAEQKLLNLITATFPDALIYFLNWPGDVAKGLDDALKSGAAISFDPATNDGPRFGQELPTEALARQFGPPKELHTLDQARREHGAVARYAFGEPDGSQYVITSATGTGKSTASDNELAYQATNGKLGGRTLLLCPNIANIDERTSPDKPLGQAIRSGKAVIQEGRRLIDLHNPEQVRSPFDCANPMGLAAGELRQITQKVVCKSCPFGSEENWKKAGGEGERPFACEVEGYIASKKASKKANLVIATKQSYLCNSDELSEFDAVAVDEGLLGNLIETIDITSDKLATWRTAMAHKNLNFPGWEQLIQIIEKAFDMLANTPAPNEDYLIDCTASMEAAAAELGHDYGRLLFECGYNGSPDCDLIYQFERPYNHNAQQILPFRSARELLEALGNKENPARFKRTAAGSYLLRLHVLRQKLVEHLKEKTLIVLDATLPATLKTLLPDLDEIKYEVPQNMHIIQVTSGLYTKRDLYNPKTRETVEKAIDAFVKPGEKSLVIMPLRFEEGAEALKLPEGVDRGHWGKDERATNQYQDYDSLVLIGHPLRPIDEIRAEVLACRAYANKAYGRPAPDKSTHSEKLRLYNCKLPNGRAAGRWMKRDSDPDVQAAIEHDHYANIIQAIGRLRPALRPASARPVRILILDSEPVGALPINQLVTIQEIITNPPKNQVFIHDNYMKTSQNGDLVPAYTDVQEGRDIIDFEVSQDETLESQMPDPPEWLSEAPPPWEYQRE